MSSACSARRSSTLFARTKPHHQLKLVIEDPAVLQDTLKLAFLFWTGRRARYRCRIGGRRRGTFYTNTAFYVLLRPLEVKSMS